ncbi:MAG: proline iminopeptidase-family hydrolase [Sediminibacterium sp.]|jgi:proline iminopeptidase
MKKLTLSLSFLFFATVFLLTACNQSVSNTQQNYHDTTGRKDILTGGVQMIPIQTEKGVFNVWTKRVGNNPKIKVLLLHGGPGSTHEYFECFDSFLPAEGIEYYYYDQLGSAYSDNPNDSSLWNLPRFVEEVETVRKALGMDSTNFFLLGHSWGGILATEYALKYQQNMKGIIISNMVPSIPDYIKYANEVLGPKLPKDVLAKIRAFEAKGDYTNPEYLQIVQDYYYPEHVLRMPPANWPDPVKRAFARMNYPLYLRMQGPSEFGVVGDAVLKTWDRKADLNKIYRPLLSIGGEFDTMDPKAMEALSKAVQKGQYLYCPNGSHMSMYDDQQTYFKGLIRFLKETGK